MASIRKRRGNYYSRIVWRSEDGRHQEKQVPLRTSKKSVAIVRNNQVKEVEDTIRQGTEWEFPWLGDGGSAKLIRRTLIDSFEEYQSVKNINGCRKSTLDRNRESFKCLTKVVPDSFPIEKMSESHIDDFKEYWTGNHKPNTINIDLAKIRAFLNWCYKKGYIKKQVDVEQIQADVKPPSYLTDSDMEKIIESESVDNHFKRAFVFYFLTGCRKAEPFQGKISGNYLIIEPDIAKSHRTREVELSPELMGILIEMRDRHDHQMRKYGYKSKSIIDRYSAEFKKACRSVGIEDRHLHNLRDTYAVRRWAITGDLFLVSKEIGHTSVSQTEKYANFHLRRLMSDFPTIAKDIEKRLDKRIQETYFNGLLNAVNGVKNGDMDTKVMDTQVHFSS